MTGLPLAVAVPLLGAAVCAVIGSAPARRVVVAVSLVTVATVGVLGLVQTVDGEVLVSRVGGFPAPFAIAFAADTFASLMLVVFPSVAAASLAFAALRREDTAPRYHAAALALVGASAGATLTADLFNLFVWIEVLLLSSYVLLTHGATAGRVRAGALYVATNFLASTVFLVGVGLVYATTGTVNLGSLRGTATSSGAVALAAVLILVSLSVKAGFVPVFAWLPRAYPAAPPAVRALFSGTLTKVGLVALYRIVSVMFDGSDALAVPILVVAGATMIVGVLGAVGRSSMGSILSFHMVSQMGYLAMALGLGTVAGLSAGVFFLVQYVAVKTGLFLTAATVDAQEGTDELGRIGGLAGRRPWLAATFLVSALSLAGIPPLSGFVAKFALVRSAFEVDDRWIAAVAVIVSLFTLVSMVKVWNGVFWGRRDGEDRERVRGGWALAVPAAALAVATVVLGLGAEALWTLSERAAEGLVDVASYARAVST